MMTLDANKPIRYYTLSIYELGDHPDLVDYINTSVVGLRDGRPVFLIRTNDELEPPCEPLEKHEIKQYFFRNLPPDPEQT